MDSKIILIIVAAAVVVYCMTSKKENFTTTEINTLVDTAKSYNDSYNAMTNKANRDRLKLRISEMNTALKNLNPAVRSTIDILSSKVANVRQMFQCIETKSTAASCYDAGGRGWG
jgi:uncharacterized protein YfkK (UPF0435 family)